MNERLETLKVAWNARRTERGGQKAIQLAQQKRLDDLVTYAREHSPLYREFYKNLPSQHARLSDIPRVTKPQLMEQFDAWVTDKAVKKSDVEAFAADKSCIGEYYLDKYEVLESSGTTGLNGIFLHDRRVGCIYNGLYVRSMSGWRYPSAIAVAKQIFRRGVRTAFVVTTGRHWAPAAYWHKAFKENPGLERTTRLLSIQTPLAELTAELNDFQPTVLTTFSSMATALAREQQEGRLKIDPVFIFTTAETLRPSMRVEVETTFHCAVRDIYGASECLNMASDCGRGWIHYNADWLILEPLDKDYQPISPGDTSHTVLLTNLANRAQPIIRYELADSITVHPNSCECGSPLPAIRVTGRTDDVLIFTDLDGGAFPFSRLQK